jgi:hypothetical protein
MSKSCPSRALGGEAATGRRDLDRDVRRTGSAAADLLEARDPARGPIRQRGGGAGRLQGSSEPGPARGRAGRAEEAEALWREVLAEQRGAVAGRPRPPGDRYVPAEGPLREQPFLKGRERPGVSFCRPAPQVEF